MTPIISRLLVLLGYPGHRLYHHYTIYFSSKVETRLCPSKSTFRSVTSVVRVLQQFEVPWLTLLSRFSLFQVISAYTNSGMSLVDQSMIPFQKAYPMIVTLIFLIIAGNTGFVSFPIWAPETPA